MKKKLHVSRALPAALLFATTLGVITYYYFTATPEQSDIVAGGHNVVERFAGFLPDRPGEYTCDRTWGVVEHAAYETAVSAATATLTPEKEEQPPHELAAAEDSAAGQEAPSDEPLRLAQADAPHSLDVVTPGGQLRGELVAARQVGGFGLPLTGAGGSGGPLGSSGNSSGTPGNNNAGTGATSGSQNLLVPDNKNGGTTDGNGGSQGNNGGNQGSGGQGGNQGNSNGQAGGSGLGGDGNNPGKSVSVPEPDVLVLMISGAIGLWFARRRFDVVKSVKVRQPAHRR